MRIIQFIRKNLHIVLVSLLLGIALLILITSLNMSLNSKSQGATVGDLETESGVIQSPAMEHDDSSASGGKYVMFPNQAVSPTPIVVSNQPTLIESYFLTEDVNAGYYNWVKYKPRQFVQGMNTQGGVDNTSLLVTNPGTYAGWDILNTPNTSINRFYTGNSYLTLNLNRPAKTAIVWKAVDPIDQSKPLALPLWLKSWAPEGTVTLGTKTFPVYTKILPEGPTPLGGIYDTANTFANQTYLVLLAEQTGQPSTPPVVPNGLEVPVSNQTCPTWVHDQYKTIGPDGNSYATWHPQIDYVFWCYFRHEHGTNPDSFKTGYKVLYNYTASKQGHQHPGEPHPGFKTLVFDDSAGQTWVVTMHFGTGSLARVCTRFHSVDVAVRNTNSTEILADVHLMGDFGQAVEHNTTNLLQPPSCPTQGTDVGTRGDGFGQRQIPVHGDGTDGYEPWIVGAKGNIIGFKPGWHINTHNPMIICDTLACANNYSTGESGDRRFLADANFLGIVAGTNTGTFYTNALGTALSTQDDPLALKQYVKAGITMQYPSDGRKCIPLVGWGRKEVCLPTTEANSRMRNYEREDSIQLPN